MSLSSDIVIDSPSEIAHAPVTRPARWQALAKHLLTAILLFALVAGAAAGWALFRVGSFGLVAPYLRGERLLVDTSALSLGEQTTNSLVEAHLHVVNLSGGDVKLLGANRTCTCLSVESFPMTIARGEARDLKIVARMGSTPAEYEESVRFFTDFPDRRDFTVAVRATVR